MNLSTSQFQLGLPLLASMDLGVLLPAMERLQGGDLSALNDVVRSLGKACEARMLSRVVAIVKATSDQLDAAQLDPSILAQLEAEASRAPFTESLQVAISFFEQLLGSSQSIHAFSRPQKGPEGEGSTQGDSPSSV